MVKNIADFRSQVSASNFRGHKIPDDLNHGVDHFWSESGVGAEEHRLLHDAVGAGEFAGNTHRSGIVATQLHKGGLAHEIAAEEHAVADLFQIEMRREFGSGKRCILLDGDFETEPRAIRAASARVPGEI